jgi:hypothetical protein
MFWALFWFGSCGNKLFDSCPLEAPNTFGDRYLALGRRSVNEKMFFERRIVFSIISFSSVFGIFML